MQNYGNILKKLQKLQNYEIKTSKQKWNAIKQETGQNKYISPTLIIEGKVHQTQPKKMADALNRMHLKSVRETINSIPNTQTNPLKSYYKYLGQDEQSKLSFTFKQISMADLSSIITSMVPTGSTSRDEISMWLVKQARVELEPQLLPPNLKDNRNWRLPRGTQYYKSNTYRKTKLPSLQTNVSKLPSLKTNVAKLPSLQTNVAKLPSLQTNVAKLPSLQTNVAKLQV